MGGELGGAHLDVARIEPARVRLVRGHRARIEIAPAEGVPDVMDPERFHLIGDLAEIRRFPIHEIGEVPDPGARVVLERVAVMALVGLVLGVAGAWLLGRAAESLLFGVEAGNPLALACAASVLAAITLCAAVVPLRRASRIDPMIMLRE